MASTDDEPRRRWPRVTAWTAAALVVVLAAGMLGLSWYFSGIGIVPDHPAAGPADYVISTGARTVTLTSSPNTLQPGEHGLAWEGGAAMVGGVVARGPGRVERRLVRGTAPLPGTRVGLAWNYPGDPRPLLDTRISTVNVATELGPAPAWYLPPPAHAPRARRSTWVIGVHGQNGAPGSILPAVLPMHRLGLPALVITYRNDIGAPASPDGLMHLGDTEWRDLDAAVRTARRMGAKRVVLAGGSMGAATIFQWLRHSSQTGAAAGIVDDAGEIDWQTVIDYQAGQYHAPPGSGWLVARIIEMRTGMDVDGMRILRHPPAARPPMLVFHGTADKEVPVRESRDLAAAGPRLHWDITYDEFPGAGHTQSWNLDPARYDAAVTAFARGVLSR
ncbi:MAG TPA: prolyl oligopeptidase family serine peptidase [Streptosporangiaceae bacterium]|jgi:hypothetical protein